MSVAGIFSSNVFDYTSRLNRPNRAQQARQDFQQLGQDLQAGNLTEAQTDFASLQQLRPPRSSSSQATSANPMVQDFTQLGQDLQSGNTSAAQQDFAKLQQDAQTQGTQAHPHHHHHHGGGGGGASAITQTLDQLGQSLQSGNLATAQQAYNSLEQEFQQFAQVNPTLLTAATSSADSGLSVSA